MEEDIPYLKPAAEYLTKLYDPTTDATQLKVINHQEKRCPPKKKSSRARESCEYKPKTKNEDKIQEDDKIIQPGAHNRRRIHLDHPLCMEMPDRLENTIQEKTEEHITERQPILSLFP